MKTLSTSTWLGDPNSVTSKNRTLKNYIASQYMLFIDQCILCYLFYLCSPAKSGVIDVDKSG